MSAGTGVTHSEFNPSSSEPVHFLQIWIQPSEAGLKPSYEQQNVQPDGARGTLKLIAARDGRDGAATIHQDSDVFVSLLDAGHEVSHNLRRGRRAWLQVIRGDVDLHSIALTTGDGAAVSDEHEVRIRARTPAHVLLFDLG